MGEFADEVIGVDALDFEEGEMVLEVFADGVEEVGFTDTDGAVEVEWGDGAELVGDLMAEVIGDTGGVGGDEVF